MFSSSVVLLAFLGLFTICHARPSKKLTIGKSVYEIVDTDERKLSVSVDEDGTAYKALSDADAVDLIKLLEINDKGINVEDTVDKVPNAVRPPELGGNHNVFVSQVCRLIVINTILNFRSNKNIPLLQIVQCEYIVNICSSIKKQT